MVGLDSALGVLAEEMVGMGHRFLIVIDNPAYNLGFWQKASGLAVKWEMPQYRTGDQGNNYHIFPGNTVYENIKLQRAISPASRIVQTWLELTASNAVPLSGALVLQNNLGLPIMEWRLYEFFPVAWNVGEFSTRRGQGRHGDLGTRPHRIPQRPDCGRGRTGQLPDLNGITHPMKG